MNETQRVISYSPKQVADLLGYKVATIYALLSRRELEARTIGRSRIISQEQLNDFLHHRKGSDVVIDYTK
jgi:excisionase family DNA binding protein